jgi:hypothetical protein
MEPPPMSTARIPVFIRVGSGSEYMVGSVPGIAAEPTDNGVTIHVNDGVRRVADLLEEIAAELRRKAEQDSP